MYAFLDWVTPPLGIVADKAHGSRKIMQQIVDEGALAVTSSKSNVRQPIPHGAGLYRHGNLVERFFCKMKDIGGWRQGSRKSSKFPINGATLRKQMLGKLGLRPSSHQFKFDA